LLTLDAEGNTGPRAKLEAEAAVKLLTEQFDELYAGKEIGLCGIDGALLFAAVKGSRYLAGHRGSGLIALLNDGCSILSKPESGGRELRDMRIYKGEHLQDPAGFMLMSDGACRSLYDTGTGNLSSACGTFFEWLKEYDEETVSEALADNIDKYFLKDGQGDIAVAVMVSEQDEAVPTKTGGKRGKFLKYIIAAIVVAAAILSVRSFPRRVERFRRNRPMTMRRRFLRLRIQRTTNQGSPFRWLPPNPLMPAYIRRERIFLRENISFGPGRC